MSLQKDLAQARETSQTIDGLIIKLRNQVQQLIPDLKKEQRLHDTGVLFGLSRNLSDGFYTRVSNILAALENENEQTTR